MLMVLGLESLLPTFKGFFIQIMLLFQLLLIAIYLKSKWTCVRFTADSYQKRLIGLGVIFVPMDGNVSTSDAVFHPPWTHVWVQLH